MRPLSRTARVVPVLLALALLARPARAQFPTDQNAIARHKAGDVIPLFGVQYGAPERYAASLGVGFATTGGFQRWAGYALIAEGGQSGARVSLATMVHGAVTIAQVRVSAIRTWRDPLVVAANQTFVGPELRLSMLYVTVGAGHYWRTAGTTPGDSQFSALTFGFWL